MHLNTNNFFCITSDMIFVETEYIRLVHHEYVIPNDMGLKISDQRNVGLFFLQDILVHDLRIFFNFEYS